MKTMTTELTSRLEQALLFSAQRLAAGRHTKPVVMHSMRVMFRLWEYGYEDPDLLVAAVLHDTIEDSDIAQNEIEEIFGQAVADIVSAVTFDEKIPYGKERHVEMFQRVMRGGRKPMLLKCADMLDNSGYYHLCGSREKELYLLKKMGDFLTISKDLIGSESVWLDLEKAYQDLTSTLKENDHV